MSSLPVFNRRGALALGLGATSSLVLAASPSAQEKSARTMNLDPQGQGSSLRDLGRRQNPILFWNNVSLQLVALDHSIDAMDARAPGPSATARALGLAHIVLTDAQAAALPRACVSL